MFEELEAPSTPADTIPRMCVQPRALHPTQTEGR